ncbi:alpha/beta fold hydrolase [Streptomyces sp. VRA16 Mangrove soil]|uniref:alpha/beta fold hydrolase n=1 Tax=Streptomyces sp. VRA16 Mangrove soil TaxID=2817434 RepID=UPI001A9F53FE|nr:alpha/beta hydrolase [Streptomyces sp. VRA16 Mangrove soil]MBO1332078.1 alpha/beta hydrolase [Streptomyces sp. VRA16 Mangrove soil]
MTWTERVVVRDGVRLACRDWGGEGPPVVLLHGLAGHAGEWDGLAASLRHRHRVVAVDQRGHGASERLPGDVSRAAYVADVGAVTGRLGLDRPVLIGQSLGAHTALLAAATGLCRAAVLVEAGPGRADPALPKEIGGWLDTWPAPFPSRRAAVDFFGGGAAGEGWADGLEERDGGLWPRFDRDVMVASLEENTGRDVWDEWTAITCPTLLVLGQNGIIGTEEVDAMFRARPDLLAVSVPGTGHDVHLERGDALRQVIEAFLFTAVAPRARIDAG